MHAHTSSPAVRPHPPAAPGAGPSAVELLSTLQGYYRAQQHLRRGICLLNAGQFDRAAEAFFRAAEDNPGNCSLPRLLAACHAGRGAFDDSAGELAAVIERDQHDVTARVRHALSLWQAGKPNEAVQSLREGLRADPDSPELHFQLGTLLAAMDELEEAELRFTQAATIDKTHTEALVSLGMCAAAQARPAEAKRHLERAQRRRPRDARVALLLTQTAKALADQGVTVDLQADMPPEASEADDPAIEVLSRVIEAEPDFVDAFLGLPTGDQNVELDREVYAVLAHTLNRALDHRPESAGLHQAAGRVLHRLGRTSEAIAAAEKAVALHPDYVQALIQLAQLYQQTNRHQDAQERLEQALQLGVRYADVYYLLGNLYRRNGKLERARWAYEQALLVNNRYEAARVALATLAA